MPSLHEAVKQQLHGHKREAAKIQMQVDSAAEVHIKMVANGVEPVPDGSVLRQANYGTRNSSCMDTNVQLDVQHRGLLMQPQYIHYSECTNAVTPDSVAAWFQPAVQLIKEVWQYSHEVHR